MIDFWQRFIGSFFFSSRRRHTRCSRDWSSDVCSSDLFLLAARLALPVMAASLDAKPTVEEAAAKLEGMGVTRIALAPCLIGPEADPVTIEEAAATVGAKCSA